MSNPVANPATPQPRRDAALIEQPRQGPEQSPGEGKFAEALARAEQSRLPSDFLGAGSASVVETDRTAAEPFNAHGFFASFRAIVDRAQTRGHRGQPQALVAEAAVAARPLPPGAPHEIGSTGVGEKPLPAQVPGEQLNRTSDASRSPRARGDLPIDPLVHSSGQPRAAAQSRNRAIHASRGSGHRPQTQTPGQASESPVHLTVRSDGREVGLSARISGLGSAGQPGLRDRIVKLLADFGIGLRSLVVNGRERTRPGRK